STAHHSSCLHVQEAMAIESNTSDFMKRTRAVPVRAVWRATVAIIALAILFGLGGFYRLDATSSQDSGGDIPDADATPVIGPQIIPESRTSPEYPWRARKEHVQAHVVLAAIVRQDGGVSDITVKKIQLTMADGTSQDVGNPIVEDELGFGPAARE